MEQQQPAQLRDVLSYTPDTYFSEGELKLIQNTFKDNPAIMKILRKILLPTIQDPELPLEEWQKDAYQIGKVWNQIPASERSQMILARQDALEFIVGGLIQLKSLANMKIPTEEEVKAITKKNSNK